MAGTVVRRSHWHEGREGSRPAASRFLAGQGKMRENARAAEVPTDGGGGHGNAQVDDAGEYDGRRFRMEVAPEVVRVVAGQERPKGKVIESRYGCIEEMTRNGAGIGCT